MTHHDGAHRIKVVARKNGPLGLQWGQEAEVPATDYVEHLIETGSLEWVQDAPELNPELSLELENGYAELAASEDQPAPRRRRQKGTDSGTQLPVVDVSSPDDNSATEDAPAVDDYPETYTLTGNHYAE